MALEDIQANSTGWLMSVTASDASRPLFSRSLKKTYVSGTWDFNLGRLGQRRSGETPSYAWAHNQRSHHRFGDRGAAPAATKCDLRLGSGLSVESGHIQRNRGEAGGVQFACPPPCPEAAATSEFFLLL